MSKYNDYMSHIRVDDDMHRRVMDAVSKAISENASGKEGEVQTDKSASAGSRADVRPLNSDIKAPVRRKKTVPLIKILSIAAAAILVAGGALYVCSRFLMVSKAPQAYNTECEDVDSMLGTDGLKGNKSAMTTRRSFFGIGNKNKSQDNNPVVGGAQRIDGDRTEGANEDIPGKEYETSGYDASVTKVPDIRDLLPFKVKTVGVKALNNGQATGIVFNGENGESVIFFTSKAGTDICKAYYPDFKGIPATLCTEGGVEFKGIDISAGNNVKVSESGPYDAVTWTKNGTAYMMVFNTKTDIKVFTAIIDKI